MKIVKTLSHQTLSLLLAIYIGLFLNLSVFIRRFDMLHPSSTVGHMVIALTEITAAILSTFFLMRILSFGGRLFYRIAASLLVLISVAASYYMTYFNVVIGYGIIASVMTTDIDLSREVVGIKFLVWMVGISALPLLLIWQNALADTLFQQMKTPGRRVKSLLGLLVVLALVWLPVRYQDKAQNLRERITNIDMPSYGGLVAHSYLPSNWLAALGLFAYTRLDESQDNESLFDPAKQFTYLRRRASIIPMWCLLLARRPVGIIWGCWAMNAIRRRNSPTKRIWWSFAGIPAIPPPNSPCAVCSCARGELSIIRSVR